MVDDLKLRLNRAAEVETPKAKKLFGDAIIVFCSTGLNK